MANITPENRVETLIEALPYIQQFRGHTFVIKYGGAAMEEENQVERLLRDIVFLEAVGINPVVVHGGGKAITSKMRAAGIHAQFVNGLRVTDAQSIQIVEETLDKEINPKIVETLNRFGGKAQGISGRSVFTASRLGPQNAGNDGLVDIGFVGAASRVTTNEIQALVKKEIVPIISPLGAEEGGTVLNINADVAAAALASSLKATKLIYVSDVRGIMRDPSVKESLIPSVTVEDIENLIEEKIIAGGMLPKVQSATQALKEGVEKIHFIGGHVPHGLLLEIFTNTGIGTEIALS
ncbi:MAG: acetylglutamate kinase [Chthoniobacterales bacterium]